jgi:hypothetical protein
VTVRSEENRLPELSGAGNRFRLRFAKNQLSARNPSRIGVRKIRLDKFSRLGKTCSIASSDVSTPKAFGTGIALNANLQMQVETESAEVRPLFKAAREDGAWFCLGTGLQSMHSTPNAFASPQSDLNKK